MQICNKVLPSAAVDESIDPHPRHRLWGDEWSDFLRDYQQGFTCSITLLIEGLIGGSVFWTMFWGLTSNISKRRKCPASEQRWVVEQNQNRNIIEQYSNNAARPTNEGKQRIVFQLLTGWKKVKIPCLQIDYRMIIEQCAFYSMFGRILSLWAFKLILWE